MPADLSRTLLSNRPCCCIRPTAAASSLASAVFRVSSASVGSRTQLHKVGEGRGVAHPAEALRVVNVRHTVLELDAVVVVGEELPEVSAAHHLAQASHEVLGHLGSKAVKVWRMEINNRI